MKINCECNGVECRCEVEVDELAYVEKEQSGQVIISDNCPHGPEPDDVLVAARDGYGVYTDSLR